jgi:hypothetical protein
MHGSKKGGRCDTHADMRCEPSSGLAARRKTEREEGFLKAVRLTGKGLEEIRKTFGEDLTRAVRGVTVEFAYLEFEEDSATPTRNISDDSFIMAMYTPRQMSTERTSALRTRGHHFNCEHGIFGNKGLYDPARRECKESFHIATCHCGLLFLVPDIIDHF